MRPLFVGFAIYRDKLQWFPRKFYELDLHKVAICIKQNCRPYPCKGRFAGAVAVAKRRICKSVDERLVPCVPRKRACLIGGWEKAILWPLW